MIRTVPAGTPLGDEFHLYDTTLRDGAQSEGITYSVSEKLAVARLLDGLGVGFIEGGWPGALPKDTEFFARAAAGELDLKHAALVAFGATRKAGVLVAQDRQVRALLDSQAPVVTLVAKSDHRHITRALRTDLAENCAMVSGTVNFLVAEGRHAFLVSGPSIVTRRRLTSPGQCPHTRTLQTLTQVVKSATRSRVVSAWERTIWPSLIEFDRSCGPRTSAVQTRSQVRRAADVLDCGARS